MDAKFVYLALCICIVNCKYVNKMNCPNVDPAKCKIHNVRLDPCRDGPEFCVISREEPYTVAFDFTPHFNARTLKVAILSDPNNSTRFSKAVTPLHDACQYTKCPVEENLRSKFEYDFEYYMKSQGKFPLQLRLWHDEDESETCCFTFNVSMLSSIN